MASKSTIRQDALLVDDARHPHGAGLLLFDLDDTIVQGGTYVSQRVLETLGRAREAGYVLSIASGRPLCTVNKELLATGVMDYAVCANGSTVTRLSNMTLVAHHPLSHEDCMRCYELLSDLKPSWNVFMGASAYFEWKGLSYMLTGRTGALARTQRYAKEHMALPRRLARFVRRGMRYVWRMVVRGGNHQVRSIAPHLMRAQDGVDKMGCVFPDERRCERALELLDAAKSFEVIRMSATEIEITARGVTKGTGARALMDVLGLEACDAVAFGDGGNDLPLASEVGRFVAVENADEAVKAAADDVCPPVNRDGVAVWIQRNLLV